MALLDGIVKVDEKVTMEGLSKIDAEWNILEVIESILKTKGIKYETKQLTCDNQLRASFILEKKTIVDVIDQQLAYYSKDGGVKQLRTRGRAAQELAVKYGFERYKLVSLLEMEFGKDEQEYLESLLIETTANKKTI